MVLRLLKLLGASALLFLTTGCQLWNLGGTTYQAPKQAFSMHVPEGWSYSTGMRAKLLATRDGLTLQSIRVDATRLDKALPYSERELSPHLFAYELAEAIVDDLRSNTAMIGLTVLANEPARIGDQEGFKLTLTYQNASNLWITETRYGAIRHGELWTLSFVAPRRHYHARDLAKFESSVASFRFGPIDGK